MGEHAPTNALDQVYGGDESATGELQGPRLSHVDSAFQRVANDPSATNHRVSLSFTDLNYVVQVGRGKHGKEKMVLQDVSGYVKPGAFVAIMGPTGSGKTSLLNILAGRVMRTRARLSGQVLVNGRPRDRNFKRISSYVMQDDVLFSTLTVRETLITAAMLRLPSSMAAADKLALADSIIRELGLSKARNTPLGNDLVRGVSGGERKRTNIAIEMLSNPSLIFLDEPTSGLDSFQALNVMSTMADLARSGRTVISTIHQPRSSIFALFENLLLLSEGRQVYSGRASEAVAHFSRLGFACPSHFNPADYFMDIISLDRRDEKREAASSARIALLTDAFASSSAPAAEGLGPREGRRPAGAGAGGAGADSLDTAGGGGGDGGGDDGATSKIMFESAYASDFATQFRVLMRRSWWQASRDRLPLLILFVQITIITLLVVVLWSGVEDDQKSIQDRQGLVFFVAVIFAFNGVFQMITTFPYERSIMNRERAANSYRISAYYPAKVAAELPLRVLPIVLFVCVSYWVVKLQRDAAKFFIFLGVAVLEYITMQAAGLMVSAVAPTPQAALALGPLMTIVFMTLGGLFINADSIPAWISWAQHVSPIHWGFVALAVCEFRGRTFSCTSQDVSCTRTGEEVLERLSINQYSVAQAVGWQCLLLAAFHLLAYLLLLNNGPKYQPLVAGAAGPALAPAPAPLPPAAADAAGAAAAAPGGAAASAQRRHAATSAQMEAAV